jgi:hypothetical protein
VQYNRAAIAFKMKIVVRKVVGGEHEPVPARVLNYQTQLMKHELSSLKRSEHRYNAVAGIEIHMRICANTHIQNNSCPRVGRGFRCKGQVVSEFAHSVVVLRGVLIQLEKGVRN